MTTAKTKPPGRWKKGESGNPAGRKPGTGQVAVLRASIAEHIPAIITQLIEQAKKGDAGAARLLLERVIPPIKASEQTIAIEIPGGTLTDQGRAVLSAVADGELAPSQGAALLGAIGTLARVTELDELAARITALEGKNATP